TADDPTGDDQSQKPGLTTNDLFSDPQDGQDGGGSGSTVIASTLTSFPIDGNGDSFDGKFATDFGAGSPFGGSNNGSWGTGAFGSGGFGGFGGGGFGGGGPVPSAGGSIGAGGAAGGQSNGQGTPNQTSGSTGDSHSPANGGNTNGGNANGGDTNTGNTDGGNA